MIARVTRKKAIQVKLSRENGISPIPDIFSKKNSNKEELKYFHHISSPDRKHDSIYHIFLRYIF
jgi:hypothetical protein